MWGNKKGKSSGAHQQEQEEEDCNSHKVEIRGGKGFFFRRRVQGKVSGATYFEGIGIIAQSQPQHTF